MKPNGRRQSGKIETLMDMGDKVPETLFTHYPSNAGWLVIALPITSLLLIGCREGSLRRNLIGCPGGAGRRPALNPININRRAYYGQRQPTVVTYNEMIGVRVQPFVDF
jgi:hypothetical protein